MNMSGIVCAIRGGPASQPTIKKSIQVALDTGLPLFFLYVVNLDFLSHTETSRVRTISQEMHQMGEFILLTAQTQAEAHGVTAKGIVRQGNVGDEIVNLCQELSAEHVILGLPQGQDMQDVFTQERLESFCKRIETESEATVIIAQGDPE
jgi:nucleotide-binding universal stress UspA family protein